MKILVVDDNHEKVEKISQAVLSANVPATIIQETSGESARRRLRLEHFDLLLIDLRLPETAGSPPKDGGGLSFFDFLLLDVRASLPDEVLFVTGDSDLAEASRQEVVRRGSALCVMSDLGHEWKDALVGQIKLSKVRRDRKVRQFDFSIITALSSELDAVLALDYGWKSFRLANDATIYHSGEFLSENGVHSVVAASAMRKGMAASAALATKLILKFSPKVLAMTGICAGVKGRVNLGDVIVGSPTWDWGSGKHDENENGSVVFRLSPKQSELDSSLETLCTEIQRDPEFRKKIRANWDRDVPAGEFSCRLGPMASGASVVATASVAQEIATQNRDLIGIEMEAFAVMVAAEFANAGQTAGIAIKSVCDYADKHKQDDWQQYAAYTSARFADELFRRFLVSA